MVNSLEYETLEDQVRSQHEAAINATLAWDARDNAGNEPYQLDGYESSSTTSTDSLNQVWYTAKAEDTEDGPLSSNHRDSTSKNWNLGRSRIVLADEKEFPTPQRGGLKTSFILLEMKSDGWFFKVENSKTQHGDSFRKIMIENGVYLLGYPRTIYTDGCGSMVHVRDMAIRMGINYIAIPPHLQSLNEAERIADRLWACARIFMIRTEALDSHFAYGMDMA